jgi:hypothetical protein
MAYDSVQSESESINVAQVEISGADKSQVDASKPKVSLGSATPNPAKPGDKITYCFVATDDKAVTRVVGRVFSADTKEWIGDATGGRRIEGTEFAGTWCLDAVIPVGRPDGTYLLYAMAYDSVQSESESINVAQVEISESGISKIPVASNEVGQSSSTSTSTNSGSETNTSTVSTQTPIVTTESSTSASTSSTNTATTLPSVIFRLYWNRGGGNYKVIETSC